MKTLIIYGTKHGCVEKIAEILAEKIKGEVDLHNLKKRKDLNLSGYDNLIIGGSVYMGQIRKEVAQFCSKNINKLREMRIGLFISCMREGEDGQKELKDNFPEELYNMAVAKGIFGGEFNFDSLNLIEKLIVKKVVGINESQTNILESNIEDFAATI